VIAYANGTLISKPMLNYFWRFEMIKRRLVVFLTVLAILSTAVLVFSAGCAEPAPTTPAPSTPTPAPTPSEPEPAPAETITLKWLLTNQGINEFNFDWKAVMGGGWAGDVEKASNGRIKFDYLVGAVTPDGMYDSLIAGAGDIASTVILINSGRFPTLELMTVPDFFTKCQRPSNVAWYLWQNTPEIQDEFSDAKVMAMFATVPSPPGIGFATIDKPITTLEDMKGVKMGIYGKWGTKMTDALGFTPVAVPAFEVYESIQRGVVDGSFMSANFLTIQNVGELVKYWHPITMNFCPFWLSMNWDSWNKLPPDIQKIMEDLATEIPDNVDIILEDEMAQVMAMWPEVEVVQIAPDEQVRWRERQNPVQAEYIAELTAKGYNGQAAFDEMNQLFREYAEALPAK
jgi:TRAP-type C4-dicarboxylate transport system substrate-binding protein